MIIDVLCKTSVKRFYFFYFFFQTHFKYAEQKTSFQFFVVFLKFVQVSNKQVHSGILYTMLTGHYSFIWNIILFTKTLQLKWMSTKGASKILFTSTGYDGGKATCHWLTNITDSPLMNILPLLQQGSPYILPILRLRLAAAHTYPQLIP